MRNLILLILLIFGMQMHAENLTGDKKENKKENVQATNKQDKKQEQVKDSSENPIEQKDNNSIAPLDENINDNQIDQDTNVTSDNIISSQWYDKEWVKLVVCGISVLAFILSIFSVFLILKNNNFVSQHNMKSYVHRKLEELENHNNSYTPNTSTNALKKAFDEIGNLKQTIYSLQSQIQQIQKQQTNVVVQNQTPSIQPPQQKQIQKDNSKNTPKQAPAKHLYACQDASDRTKLMKISDKFDKWSHTFDITLDPNSSTTGSFCIVEDKEIQERCLNNSDSILCCNKEGSGSSIRNQKPGRVTINGNTATVTLAVVIQLA